MESPLGTLGVSADSTPTVPGCWCRLEGTCDSGKAGFSASLINAVSGPDRLDWSSSCVPLTRGPKIPWRILWGPWGCSQSLCPGCVGDGTDQKGNTFFFLIYFSLTQYMSTVVSLPPLLSVLYFPSTNVLPPNPTKQTNK
jgi:hypothetical protein